MKPTINMNGTSAGELAKQARECGLSLRKAVDALCAMAPHGRDYQHDATGDAYRVARAEHEVRIAAVRVVLAEVTELFEHAQTAANKREERKAQVVYLIATEGTKS